MLLKILFWLAAMGIITAMAAYGPVVNFIAKIKRKHNTIRGLKKDYTYLPSVAVLVSAHNEEAVIEKKLLNLLITDYPKDLLEIVIMSDASTDNTISIVKKFIEDNKSDDKFKITLYEASEHKGKTNAQNEAVKKIDAEVIVMTDANSMFEKSAVKELVSCLCDSEVKYVTGTLAYANSQKAVTAANENTYWNMDLKIRKSESDIMTITAGNGAIYACRKADYYDFKPILCHDSAMPIKYALDGYRAVYNEKAVAYENAGETNEDEFKRKVRMNRGILYDICPDIRIFNIFKYKWFSLFYLCHRTLRYMLFINHLMVLCFSYILAIITDGPFWTFAAAAQLLFYAVAIYGTAFKSKNKIVSLITYYTQTIVAQAVGIYNQLTGKSKPFWEVSR